VPLNRRERPLRILHLINHSEAGGLTRYVHDLCAELHALGHDVRVAGAKGAWHRLFAAAPFPFIDVPLDRGPLGLWRATRALRQHIAEQPVDVLHSHYRRTTLVARRLQEGARPPVLYTLHLSDLPITWRTRLLGDYGDHVHVAAAEGRRWIVEAAGVEPSRVTLISHGIDVERFPRADDAVRRAARRQLKVGDTDRVAAYVGRLDTPKNEDWLLDVADRSRDSIPNLKVLVAGAGPHDAAFRQQIAQRNLKQRVLSLGELEDPLPVYQAADALLLPSQREGFSLSNAEAMSVGVPACRTRTAGADELIVDHVTGRMTPIDREAFVATAIEFLADADALRRMGRAAAEHVREHFTFDRQVRDTLALYRRLAGVRESSGVSV
jgi:glycosyltransferase involved in cell wall biosynthesis